MVESSRTGNRMITPDPEHDTAYSGDNIVAITMTILAVLIVLAGSGFYWYYSSKTTDFAAVYQQLGIHELPTRIENNPKVHIRLEQLQRESCYIDAITALGQALLDLGYPAKPPIV
jgi:hypothetical protein